MPWVDMPDVRPQFPHVDPAQPVAQHLHGAPGRVDDRAEPAEDWPTRLRRAAVTDVYEVRMAVEVHAARLAARRRTPEDVTAIRAALEGRRAAGTADDAAFVDADIAFHAAVVAAAHNPVLADLFAEFSTVLREGLIELLSLTGLRADDPDTGDEAHEALVRAVADGDAEGAAEVLRGELEDPFAPARTRGPQ